MFYPFSSPSLFLFPEAERRRGRRKGVEGGGIRPPPSNPLYAPLPAPRSGGGEGAGAHKCRFFPRKRGRLPLLGPHPSPGPFPLPLAGEGRGEKGDFAVAAFSHHRKIPI